MVHCSFVAITSTDLAAARRFWVDTMGFEETERGETHFIVDAGGLRLSVDLADGVVHIAGGKDPVIGFRVDRLGGVVDELRGRGLEPESGPQPRGPGCVVAIYRDPDGRCVVLESDQ